jgi:hypothetical protein
MALGAVEQSQGFAAIDSILNLLKRSLMCSVWNAAKARILNKVSFSQAD